MQDGTYPTIMLRHDSETFFQRSFVVSGSHPLVQIVYECEVGIVQMLGLLHDADAPIEIGGESILQVVKIGNG